MAIAKGPDRDAGREWFHTDGPGMRAVPTAAARSGACISCSACATRRTASPSPRTAPAVEGDRASELDEIAGIGAARKRALLNHFGSARGVKMAGLADLEAAPGINRRRRGGCTRISIPACGWRMRRSWDADRPTEAGYWFAPPGGTAGLTGPASKPSGAWASGAEIPSALSATAAATPWSASRLSGAWASGAGILHTPPANAAETPWATPSAFDAGRLPWQRGRRRPRRAEESLRLTAVSLGITRDSAATNETRPQSVSRPSRFVSCDTKRR